MGEGGVAARPAEIAKSRTRREMAVYGEGVRQRDIDRAARAEENREAKRRRGELLEGAAPTVAQPVEVPRAWPPWGFEQRREAVWRARERAEDALDILCRRGVPMPLTKRRLESACEGEGLSIAVYTAVRRTNCPSGSRSVLTHKGLPRRTCSRCATGKDADRIRLLPH